MCASVDPSLACTLTDESRHTASNETATNAVEDANVRPARQNSLSAETLQALEKRLAQRPDRQELQDRNILKGTLQISCNSLRYVVC
jgi:RPEL repeat